MSIRRHERRVTTGASADKAPATAPSGRGAALARALVRGLALVGGWPANAAADTYTESSAATPARSASGLPCPAHVADFMRPPVLRYGAEFEVMHLEPEALERLVAGEVGDVTRTPMTWRMWLGLDGLPDKGRDQGWKVAPELAFPHNTYEVITPALNASSTGDVHRVGRALHDAGATVDSDAAFHVHLEHRTFRTDQLVTLLQLWHVHGEMLFRLSNTNMRQRNFYARDVAPALADALRLRPPRTQQALSQAYRQSTSRQRYFSMAEHALRFYAVNLAKLTRGPTLELRAYQFAHTPHPDQAVAFVELSLALALFVRDGGDTACLLRTSLDPDRPEDVETFLDLIGLTEASFATTRAELKKHTQRDHGFIWQDGEKQGTAVDAAVGSGALAVPYALRHRSGLAAAVRAGANGVALAAALRCAAVSMEALGLSDYRNTYAARDVSYAGVVQARLLIGAIAYLLSRLKGSP